jgi:hypothetical protein
LNWSPPQSVEIDRSADWPNTLSFVRDYWLTRRGGRSMPRRSDISPAQLKAQLPHILLADVIDGGADFRYRLVGTELLRFFYAEPSGKQISKVLAPFGEATVEGTLASYRGVMERRAPVRITGAGAWYGQEPKLFDAYLAPLSDDDVTINMILGTFVFEWDREHQFRQPLDPRQGGPSAA